MFEFLIGKYYYNESFEGEVTGFNKKTNKLIVNGIDDDENEKTIEVDIFGSEIEQNINLYENWEEKLYITLKNESETSLYIRSTESRDNWDIEIHRKEYPLKSGKNCYLSDTIIVSYIITFCEEVKGQILSFQKTSEQDEKERFIDWINEQVEEVSEFNSIEDRDYVKALVVSESFSNKEESDLAHNLFWEYENKLWQQQESIN